MAEQSSEWEKNRALSVSQGGTGKQIGANRAQMYLAEGGILKMQYADYPAMPIADLTGKQESAATVPTGGYFYVDGLDPSRRVRDVRRHILYVNRAASAFWSYRHSVWADRRGWHF